MCLFRSLWIEEIRLPCGAGGDGRETAKRTPVFRRVIRTPSSCNSSRSFRPDRGRSPPERRAVWALFLHFGGTEALSCPDSGGCEVLIEGVLGRGTRGGFVMKGSCENFSIEFCSKFFQKKYGWKYFMKSPAGQFPARTHPDRCERKGLDFRQLNEGARSLR